MITWEVEAGRNCIVRVNSKISWCNRTTHRLAGSQSGEWERWKTWKKNWGKIEKHHLMRRLFNNYTGRKFNSEKSSYACLSTINLRQCSAIENLHTHDNEIQFTRLHSNRRWTEKSRKSFHFLCAVVWVCSRLGFVNWIVQSTWRWWAKHWKGFLNCFHQSKAVYLPL